MVFLILGTLAAGLFAGAAVYISAVEHPARVSCGTELALSEFAPSYRRATIMQVPLALVGCVAGVVGGCVRHDMLAVVGALLLGAVVPFTLLVIRPTNERLLDPALHARSAEAAVLLARWGRLHGVRSALGSASFLILLIRLAAGAHSSV